MMKLINKLIFLLFIPIMLTSCKTDSKDNFDEIIPLFEKAETLYANSDGLSSENYLRIEDKFFLNGDENSTELSHRIAEYSEVFSAKKCKEIFDGNRTSGESTYTVNSFGTDFSGNITNLTAEDILSQSFDEYQSITLFSAIRGKNFSYGGGYIKVNSRNSDEIQVTFNALYFGNHNDYDDYNQREVEWDYQTNEWKIVNSDSPDEVGQSYTLYETDSIKELSYTIISENGSWKFDTFELPY